MNIVDVIKNYWTTGRKTKRSPSGWITGNAVCCPHNGSTIDTRSRGGLIQTGTDLSYHCFNCGYKASYQPGRHLTRKMKQLLVWLGASDDVINKLTLEALKVEADANVLEAITIPVFENKPLPNDSILLSEATVSDFTIPAIEYVYSRGLTLDSYNFYVSYKLADRIIIPYYYEKRVVGFTARKLTDGKPKYYSEQTPGYVFNLDNQSWDHQYVIVVEGPIDALSINAIAILGADIMEKQALQINNLNRQVILVPDRDKDGLRTIDQAISYGWAVSMPPWSADCKDTNDALRKYGKIYTLSSILDSAETYELKIRLRAKQWVPK
jgi:hypothetical protein